MVEGPTALAPTDLAEGAAYVEMLVEFGEELRLAGMPVGSGDLLAYSGAMRRLAVELGKIASDLRLLSMGPRAGLAEITLPAV